MSNKVIVKIARCEISSAGFLIKEAWIVNKQGKFLSKANISDKFAVAMKGTDLVLEVPVAVKSEPKKEPQVEIQDPRQQDMFIDE
tara:strand:- start:12924 stop:13178 length:255 start_codon:yes stop_codon:yes gene_type:complete